MTDAPDDSVDLVWLCEPSPEALRRAQRPLPIPLTEVLQNLHDMAEFAERWPRAVCPVDPPRS